MFSNVDSNIVIIYDEIKCFCIYGINLNRHIFISTISFCYQCILIRNGVVFWILEGLEKVFN